MPNSSFSHSEASELLAKAAHLAALSQEGDTTSLTLEEVREAAQAAGIDPAWVDMALVADPETPDPKRAFGMETSVHRLEVIPHRIDPDEWGRMVLALRREFLTDGTAESFGNIHTWSHTFGLRVTIENGPSGATVRMDQDWTSDVKTLTILGILLTPLAMLMMAAYFGTGEGGLAVLSTMLFALCASLTFGTRFLYARRLSRLNTRLDSSMKEIRRLATQSEVLGNSETAPVSGGILDEDFQEAPAANTPSRVQTRA
ncbi:MAG: hypothetical protein HKN29_08650 [Rhodothermales bacterium]|nr:hypothetical protein [Rhodothermales bacterium]